MDINSTRPLNASPQPDSPPPANESAFAHQLSGFQYSPPHAADSLLPQVEADSPYLDTGHPYSQYLDSAYPYPSPCEWQHDLYTRTRERSPHPSEQRPHARVLQDTPEHDQDQHVEAAGPRAGSWQVGPSRSGPSQAGPSSSATPLNASPPPHATDLETEHPYSQYLDWANPSLLDWQHDLHTRATASPAPLTAERGKSPQPSEQQPHARALQVPEYDQDLIWQRVDAAGPQAGPWQVGPSHSGPSQARPSHAWPSSSAGAEPTELSDFVMDSGVRAWDHWFLAPHMASEDQMSMLRATGLMPTAEVPTTTFLMMGMPHVAEFRGEGVIRIRPSLDFDI
ncbi:type II secretion system effector nodulation protein NopL [Sinorhizobium fredii]|uniref:type II secretion system effector nodulation protein NopL n=1 Tax=Rhizobium fredii TaxID=380 RepID=UPI002109A826|nr:type II secretion system effector nodulation protein NopL [Sinorhizobium fredii]UTY47776.1 nodulation protein NodL [Sinorhizobium fredii]